MSDERPVTEVVSYQRTRDAIWSGWDIGLGDQRLLILHARGLRRGRDGLTRGEVTVAIGPGPHHAVTLSWDHITIERDRDRVHLANAAAKTTDLVDAALVRELLDYWARRLWRAWLTGLEMVDDAGTDEVSTVDWLIRPWIARHAGTILFAPPGSGKSYLSLILAQSLQYGVATPLGRPEATARVLYLNLERSRDSMRARLGRVNQALGLPVDARLTFLHARGSTLADVADRVAQAIADTGYELVIVDSVSRAGAGSLIEDDVANSIVDTLNSWGVAWLAIAHTAKANEGEPKRQTVFGSQMQTAAADLVVRVTPDDDTGDHLALSLELVKANDARRGHARYVVLEMGERGLERVRAAEPEEVQSVAQRTGAWRDVVREVLRYGPKPLRDIIRAAGEDPENEAVYGRWQRRLHREGKQGRLVALTPPGGREVMYALPAERQKTSDIRHPYREGMSDDIPSSDIRQTSSDMSDDVAVSEAEEPPASEADDEEWE
jgi:hypothetical protein